MTSKYIHYREHLQQAKRIVVKVGTHVLVDKQGRPNQRRIALITKEIAQLQKSGKQVILVSSGAIGAGIQAMGHKKRPTALPDLQMAAAIGQTRLLAIYNELFQQQHCLISQVLLTHDDLRHRKRHLNARNTMLNLLRNNVIPIVNENDVVSVDEIKVGDNDVLSSLVTILVDADLLVLLTTPDGLRQPVKGGKTIRVPYLDKVDENTQQLVTGKSGALSTGGMSTKLKAANTAAKNGALVVIAPGAKKNVLQKITNGADVGTLIGNKQVASNIKKRRKRWISFFQKSKGAIVVDDGAQLALVNKNKSLLPIGVKKVIGHFEMGDLVDIQNLKQQQIGHGLVEYNSEDIAKIQGCKTAEVAKILGSRDYDEIIHRDNMVIL